MNKSDIIVALRNKGVANPERTLDDVLSVFTLGLACGEDVAIQNWGRLSPRTRRSVVRKNPKTGLPMTCPVLTTVTFVPAPALKRRLNGSPK